MCPDCGLDHTYNARCGKSFTLADIQQRAFEHAKSKGFHDLPEVSVFRFAALIHSEVSELVEAYHKGDLFKEAKPGMTAAEEELADIVIRVADFAEWLTIDLHTAVLKKMHHLLGEKN